MYLRMFVLVSGASRAGVNLDGLGALNGKVHLNVGIKFWYGFPKVFSKSSRELSVVSSLYRSFKFGHPRARHWKSQAAFFWKNLL